MRTFPEDDERDTLLDGWEEAANGWGRQADRVRDAAMPVSAWIVEHAQLRPGIQVLELAAGPGDTGFLAAEQIKPGGTLICSDAVEAMLAVARERAAEQGVENVEFKQLQLEWIDLSTATIDAVLVKWGVMLTLDPGAALRECRRVLKPGCHIALSVWDAPEKNPWTTIPQQALIDLGLIEPPASSRAGMFSLADPEALREVLADSGFFEIVVEPIEMPRHYDSLTDWIGQTVDLSRGFRGAWSQLDDDRRRALRARLEELACQYIDASGALLLPATSLGAAASA